jgi:hypothetical protein
MENKTKEEIIDDIHSDYVFNGSLTEALIKAYDAGFEAFREKAEEGVRNKLKDHKNMFVTMHNESTDQEIKLEAVTKVSNIVECKELVLTTLKEIKQ